MSIEKNMRSKKNKFFIFLLTFFFLLMCIGISAGASLYNYLWSFSRELGKDPNSVKPIAVKGKNDPVNILVMGVDVGSLGVKDENNHKRTDTIILVNYNPSTDKVNLVSIPRDTLVIINKKNQKINAAHAIGGVSYLISAVETLLNIRINYYGKVDYAGFRELIDTIGGVDVQIPNRMDYDDPAQNLHIHFKKGEFVHLDGKKAEEFFRWRKNNDGTGLADGDLGRIENQHVFIERVLDKFKNVSILPKIPDILKVIPKYAETNMDAEAILKYGVGIAKSSSDNVRMITLKGDLANIDSTSYLIYDKKKNDLLLSLLQGKETAAGETKLEKNKLSIQVLNGTRTNGLAADFSGSLKEQGYAAITTGNGSKASKSIVTVYGIDKNLLSTIKEDFGFENVVYREEKKGNYDIVVLLGDDYKGK